MKKIRTFFSSVEIIIIVGLVSLCANVHAQTQPPGTGTCAEMGGESGWGLWKASLGYYYYSTGVPTFFSNGLSPAANAPRFAINSGGGIDPCTPGGGGPAVPLVCPGFGNASIQLGQRATDGINGGCSSNGPYPAPPLVTINGIQTQIGGNGCAERLTYPLWVTSSDTNFVYAYAVVLEDPTGTPHNRKNVPFAEIYILDQNGDTIPCSHRKFMGDTTGSGGVPAGMYAGSCSGSVNNGQSNGYDVAYKPWQIVGLNLIKYINQTVTVVITNADCAWGGHYCHSYWDFNCPPVTGTALPFCVGQQTTIIGPVSTPDNPYTYQWYQNGHPYTGLPGATSSSITPTPAIGDTFSVHVFQSSGCSYWMPFAPVGTKIIPYFSLAGSCGNMTFTDSSTVFPVSTTNTVVAWNWQFPGGSPSSSTLQNPGHVSYPPGTYTVTLSVTSTAGCSDTIQRSFTVPSLPPVANFSAPPVCLGASTAFTNLSSGGAKAWSWNFGDGGTSTLQTPTHTYSAPGTYTVTLIASAGICGNDTISIPVKVNPLPVVNMKGTNVCLNNANAFTDLSQGNNSVSSWAWNFGDGNTSAAQNPTHTYGNPGTYAVTLTVTNNFRCVSSHTIQVVVNPLPVPVLTPDTICAGSTATLSASGGSIYAWNNGSSSSSISVTPSSTTSYSVTVTDTNGCSNTGVTSVVVNPLPLPLFSTGPVCVGIPIQVTNATSPAGGVTWSWSFPGGSPSSSTSQSPTVTFPAGNYTASLTVKTAAGCTATITRPITVNPLPVVNMKGTNVCFNNANAFTDLSQGNNSVSSWAWNFGDGNTSASSNPTHTYGNPGTYAVTLTVTNNFGCVSSHTIHVVVNPLPAANFSSKPVCLHDQTCFTDNSSVSPGNVIGWSWNFGDPSSGSGNISNLQNPCHTFTGAGPYTVILTVTSDSGCQNTTQQQATLYPLPVSNFTAPPVCLGSPTAFTDKSTVSPGTITGWNWNFGDNSSGSGQHNPSHTYPAAGSYTVTLIVTTSQGCKDTIAKPITIYALPVAAFTHPDSGCAPVCKTFNDLSQAGSGAISGWMWTFPGGSPSTSPDQNGSACWNSPGSYGVGLIVTNTYGCKDSVFVPNYINAYGKPTADFCVSPSQAPASDPVFSFCPLWTPNPGVTHWEWNFGDGSSLDTARTNPVHSYSATANGNDYYDFNVCLKVINQHGCPDSICKPVELVPEFTFYIPNCVTPNGDGINDLFFGKCRGVKEYTMWVFDRWGNLLWDCHRDDRNVNWDRPGIDGLSSACKWDVLVHGGHYILKEGGRDLVQEDVYVWKVRLTDIFDKVHDYIGHVSVVR